MARECGGRAHENKGTSGTDTYTSLWTGAKNVFSPSSVVEYARLPAKTWGERSEGRVPRQRWMGAHLEARSLLDDRLLRSRRHAVLSDRGGGGVRHFEGGGRGWTGGFFVRMNLLNRFLRVKLGG